MNQRVCQTVQTWMNRLLSKMAWDAKMDFSHGRHADGRNTLCTLSTIAFVCKNNDIPFQA